MDELTAIEALKGGWGVGSFGSVDECVAYHFDEHGDGRTLLQYLYEADAFPRHHAAMLVRSDGTLKFQHRDDRFLIVEAATQRILLYGRNER